MFLSLEVPRASSHDSVQANNAHVGHISGNGPFDGYIHEHIPSLGYADNIADFLFGLRGDPRLLKAPPYLSALCIVIGVCYLLLLPLNEYSRGTYISENALLPGQVHTYFAGSEQNVFRAYRSELDTVSSAGHHEYYGPWSVDYTSY